MNSFKAPALSFALLVVLLLFLHADPAAAVLPRDLRNGKAATINLYQACLGQLAEICSGYEEDRADCLASHFAKITSKDCRHWVSARTVCVEFVKREPTSKCYVGGAAQTNYRECIRDMPHGKLPQACSSSEYYYSIPRQHR